MIYLSMFIFLLAVGACIGQVLLDQKQTSTASLQSLGTPVRGNGQSFTAGYNQVLRSVSVSFGGLTVASSVQLALVEGESVQGTPMAVSSTVSVSILNTPGFVNFTFPDHCKTNLRAYHTYTWRFESISSLLGLSAHSSITNVYEKGLQFVNGNILGSKDFAFMTFGNPSSTHICNLNEQCDQQANLCVQNQANTSQDASQSGAEEAIEIRTSAEVTGYGQTFIPSDTQILRSIKIRFSSLSNTNVTIGVVQSYSVAGALLFESVPVNLLTADGSNYVTFSFPDHCTFRLQAGTTYAWRFQSVTAGSTLQVSFTTAQNYYSGDSFVNNTQYTAGDYTFATYGDPTSNNICGYNQICESFGCTALTIDQSQTINDAVLSVTSNFEGHGQSFMAGFNQILHFIDIPFGSVAPSSGAKARLAIMRGESLDWSSVMFFSQEAVLFSGVIRFTFDSTCLYTLMAEETYTWRLLNVTATSISLSQHTSSPNTYFFGSQFVNGVLNTGGDFYFTTYGEPSSPNLCNASQYCQTSSATCQQMETCNAETDCLTDFEGGGWELVRFIPASSRTWGQANTFFAEPEPYGACPLKTADYGDYFSSSISFDAMQEVMFMFGDKTTWLVTTMEFLNPETSTNFILVSNTSASPYEVSWPQNAFGFLVSTSSSSGSEFVYAENYYNSQVNILAEHGGAYVYARNHALCGSGAMIAAGTSASTEHLLTSSAKQMFQGTVNGYFDSIELHFQPAAKTRIMLSRKVLFLGSTTYEALLDISQGTLSGYQVVGSSTDFLIPFAQATPVHTGEEYLLSIVCSPSCNISTTSIVPEGMLELTADAVPQSVVLRTRIKVFGDAREYLCGEDEYQVSPLTSESLPQCQQIRECTVYEYEYVPPSPTSNRVCKEYDQPPVVTSPPSGETVMLQVGEEVESGMFLFSIEASLPTSGGQGSYSSTTPSEQGPQTPNYRIYQVKEANPSATALDSTITDPSFFNEQYFAGISRTWFSVDASGTVSMEIDFPISLATRYFDISVAVYDNKDMCVEAGETLATGHSSPCYELVKIRVYIARWKNCYAQLARSNLTNNLQDVVTLNITAPTLDSDYPSSYVSSSLAGTEFSFGDHQIVYDANPALYPIQCYTMLKVLRGVEVSTTSVGHKYLPGVYGAAGVSVDFIAENSGLLLDSYLGVSSRSGAQFQDIYMTFGQQFTLGIRAGQEKQFNIQVNEGIIARMQVDIVYCLKGTVFDSEAPLYSMMAGVTLDASSGDYVLLINTSTANIGYTTDAQCFRIAFASEPIPSTLSFSAVYFSLYLPARRRSVFTETLLFSPVASSVGVVYTPDPANTRTSSTLDSDPGAMTTIDDIIPPSFTGCPTANVVSGIGYGESYAYVNWAEPTATDNIGVVRMEQNAYPGDIFTVKGSPHLVQYKAYDSAGLEGTCSFFVNVMSEQFPITMSQEVPQEELLQTWSGGLVSFSPFVASRYSDLLIHENTTALPFGPHNITGMTTLSFYVHAPSGERYELKAVQGATVVVLEVDLVFSLTNFTNLTIDASPSPISNTTFATAEFVDFLTVDEGSSLSEGWFLSDEETTLDTALNTLRIKGKSKPLSGGFSFSGITVSLQYPEAFFLAKQDLLTFTLVTDISTLGFTYYYMDSDLGEELTFQTTRGGYLAVVDNEPPSFGSTCPDDIQVAAQLGTNFGLVSWDNPIATDNKGIAVVEMHVPYKSGNVFYLQVPAEPVTVWYEAKDFYGNSAFCNFTVLVVDEEPPVLECPDVVTRYVDSTKSTYSFDFKSEVEVSCYDNSEASCIVENDLINVYSVGVYTETLSAFDDAENQVSCSFVVEIVDDTPPSLTCELPEAIVATATSSSGAKVNFNVPTPTDNDGIASLVYSPAKSEVFPIGITEVTAVATDYSGNSVNCSFIVTVLASAGASGSSSASLNTATLSGIISAVAVVGIAFLALLFMLRKARNAKRRPVNFDELMEQLQTIPGLQADANGVRRPREVKRQAVRVLETLGKGNFGEVAKGILTEYSGIPGYLVALKTLHSGIGSEKKEILQEAAIMAQFQHERIVSLVGVVTVGEPLIVILEYCEHGALNSYLQRVEVDDKTKLLLAGDCADGLAYLSSRGFVHRDVAARNVLVSSERRAKIADFGMSRDTEQAAYYNSKGGQVPVRWTAPEALEERKFSSRSDCWSFGVLVHEIWTKAELPYKGWSNQKVWVEVLAGSRLPCPSGCPDNVYQVLLQCWSADSYQRPSFEKLSVFFYQYRPDLNLSMSGSETALTSVTPYVSDNTHPEYVVLIPGKETPTSFISLEEKTYENGPAYYTAPQPINKSLRRKCFSVDLESIDTAFLSNQTSRESSTDGFLSPASHDGHYLAPVLLADQVKRGHPADPMVPPRGIYDELKSESMDSGRQSYDMKTPEFGPVLMKARQRMQTSYDVLCFEMAPTDSPLKITSEIANYSLPQDEAKNETYVQPQDATLLMF